MTRTIDLNCDLGEGIGDDAELLRYVSSANIACGAHAGNVETMRRTIRNAIAHRVAIGAHPGFDDPEYFGRRPLPLSSEEIYKSVQRQIAELAAIAREEGASLHHVKPHGALYNMAARDRLLADAIARAVFDVDRSLTLVGPPNSRLLEAGQALGLAISREGFADRTYEADGSLTPRSERGGVISDPSLAAEQALRMVVENKVRTQTGDDLRIDIDTICIHGDEPSAVAVARAVRRCLEGAGIVIAWSGSEPRP